MRTDTENIPKTPVAESLLAGGIVAAPVSVLEPFVDAQAVAEFLSLRRPEVLKLTREGKIRGYAYRGRQRHVYRYRISEVSSDFAALIAPVQAKIPTAAPVSHRRKSNG